MDLDEAARLIEQSGVLDANDLSGFLRMLRADLGVIARRRGDGSIELSASPGAAR